MWGEGGVLQKMMNDAKGEGYVSFPLDYNKLCQNLPIFYVKIMIFIKSTIFTFITVTSSDKKVLSYVTSSFSFLKIPRGSAAISCIFFSKAFFSS